MSRWSFAFGSASPTSRSALVGQRGVAAHAVVVLHPPLGGQAVVVPADRVEDRAAAHAVEPGQRVDLDVAEHRAEVELAADRRGRCVDGVDLVAGAGRSKAVGRVGLPARVPSRLEAVEGRLVGDGAHRANLPNDPRRARTHRAGDAPETARSGPVTWRRGTARGAGEAGVEPWVRRTAMVAGVLVAIAAALLRQRGVASWRTLWAEDGSVYAQQAIREGALHSVLHSYSGYLQLPVRLVALPAPALPTTSLAAYMAVAGATIAALLGLFVFHMSRGWIEPWWLRLGLAALYVLMPILGRENTANVTNSIWLFATAAPWAILSARRSGPRRWCGPSSPCWPRPRPPSASCSRPSRSAGP